MNENSIFYKYSGLSQNGLNFWWWDLHWDGDLVLMQRDIYLKIFSCFFISDFIMISLFESINYRYKRCSFSVQCPFIFWKNTIIIRFSSTLTFRFLDFFIFLCLHFYRLNSFFRFYGLFTRHFLFLYLCTLHYLLIM